MDKVAIATSVVLCLFWLLLKKVKWLFKLVVFLLVVAFVVYVCKVLELF